VRFVIGLVAERELFDRRGEQRRFSVQLAR
jgi:hypothetical protein